MSSSGKTPNPDAVKRSSKRNRSRSASRAGHTSRRRRSKLGGISAATTNSSVCKYAAHSRVQYRRPSTSSGQVGPSWPRIKNPETETQPQVLRERPGFGTRTPETRPRTRHRADRGEPRYSSRPGTDQATEETGHHPSARSELRRTGSASRQPPSGQSTSLGRRLVYVSKVNLVRRSNSGLNHFDCLYSRQKGVPAE